MWLARQAKSGGAAEVQPPSCAACPHPYACAQAVSVLSTIIYEAAQRLERGYLSELLCIKSLSLSLSLALSLALSLSLSRSLSLALSLYEAAQKIE